MSELSESIQGLVEQRGDKVGIHTPQCFIWGTEHENCVGCEFEMGCSKLTSIMLVMVGASNYPPNDYDGFVRQQNHIKELTDKILKAKTRKQLEALPDL